MEDQSRSYIKVLVNRVLRRHNDAVYYPLAIRAVAQQIDQLYWDSATHGSSENGADGTEDSKIGRIDDLTRDEYVKKSYTQLNSLLTWPQSHCQAARFMGRLYGVYRTLILVEQAIRAPTRASKQACCLSRAAIFDRAISTGTDQYTA